MKPSSDRVAGALLGLAAGDALGAPYEFGPPVDPAAVEPVGGGIANWAPGEWTDDTQMTICIAQVTAEGSRDTVAIGRRFLDWYASRPPDVGNQTRAVLGGAKAAEQLAMRAREHYRAYPNHSAGNGSLMRTAPVALACLGDDEQLAEVARGISDLTHADPLAGDACVLWCVAIDRAVRHGRLDGIRDGLRLIPDRQRAEQWESWLEEAERRPPGDFTPNGFVVTALQAAHAAISQTAAPENREGRHLELALRCAVGTGDDTDTVAAIAGALLGARWGRSAIPLRWQRILHGWPGLRSRDLVSLAVRTAQNAGGDPSGWPNAEKLLPYYRQHDPHRPVVVPAPGDEGLLLGNVHGLEEALQQGVDAVVSLCRMGTREVPDGVEHVEVHLVDKVDSNANMPLLLDDLAGTLGDLRREGKRVFLHCVGGRSRTPTVAAWHLAAATGKAPAAALEEVAGVLPEVLLNPEFERLLRSAAVERLGRAPGLV